MWGIAVIYLFGEKKAETYLSRILKEKIKEEEDDLQEMEFANRPSRHPRWNRGSHRHRSFALR